MRFEHTPNGHCSAGSVPETGTMGSHTRSYRGRPWPSRATSPKRGLSAISSSERTPPRSLLCSSIFHRKLRAWSRPLVGLALEVFERHSAAIPRQPGGVHAGCGICRCVRTPIGYLLDPAILRGTLRSRKICDRPRSGWAVIGVAIRRIFEIAISILEICRELTLSVCLTAPSTGARAGTDKLSKSIGSAGLLSIAGLCV
jgi:hypothetical protein